MPPMFDMPETPSITSTSPGVARLCASNSAILFTALRAPSSASARGSTLRTVSAGPTMREPAIVGRRICAPTTPELVHRVRYDPGRVAEREEALDHALR